MSVLKKLKSKESIVFSPKERTQEANREIQEIMQKYNCRIEIGHQIMIIPLEDKN